MSQSGRLVEVANGGFGEARVAKMGRLATVCSSDSSPKAVIELRYLKSVVHHRVQSTRYLPFANLHTLRPILPS